MYKKILHKLWSVLRTVRIYKSWPLMLWASIRDFESPEPTACELRSGITFLIKSKGDIHVLKEIITYDHYGKFLADLTGTGTVIDIGAHIGVFSIMAAQRGKEMRVFSFEPLPDNFILLKKNIALNSLEAKVFPFQLAIGGKHGIRQLRFFSERTGSSLHDIPGQQKTRVFDVQSITLADIFEENRIDRCDILKVDCEGSEYEIILNTPPEYLRRIKSITMETHDNITGNSKELSDFLKQNGFSVSVGDPSSSLLFARNANM